MMPDKKHAASEEEAVSAETSAVEPAGGELTEDELDEAVGGVGSADEQVPEGTSERPGTDWWSDPNG